MTTQPEKTQAHDLLGDPLPEPLPSGERFRYFDQLVGHTILAVFEGMQCARDADVVIVTETKCWLAAGAEDDGDSADICVYDTYSQRSLNDYVKAKDLLDSGCINQGEFEVLRKAEEAREAVARERVKNLLRRKLDELESFAAREKEQQ